VVVTFSTILFVFQLTRGMPRFSFIPYHVVMLFQLNSDAELLSFD